MSNKYYQRKRHSVFNTCYHLIWSPKYRKPFLMRFHDELKKHIMIKAMKINCLIENIDIMPDHIHIFIRCKTNTLSVSKIVQYLKGYSSFMIRKNNPYMKKYKSLWSPSYFSESIGHMSQSVIKKYVDEQKINMKKNYKYKSIVSSWKRIVKNDDVEKSKSRQGTLQRKNKNLQQLTKCQDQQSTFTTQGYSQCCSVKDANNLYKNNSFFLQ